MAGYAFRDSAAAARRLAMVAAAFEPSSRAFLERFAGGTPGLAVDLGCGPGHTTLLLDEVEEIHTDHPVLRAYLDAVAKLLAMRGQRLEVGRLLEGLSDPGDLRRADSRVVSLSPPTALVGEMFGMNLTVWRDDPLAAEVATPAVLDEIAAGLGALARVEEPAAITWRLRQLAFERPQ